MEKKQPLIYIICGKAQHGKDSVATFIADYYKKQGRETLDLDYAYYIKEFTKAIKGWDGKEETKPRDFLQYLGTEIIRKEMDPLMCVKRLCEDIQLYSFFFDVITVSDARFESEVRIPRTQFKNVKVIQVVRPNFDNGLTERQQNHATETGLDEFKDYDYVIQNDGSLEDLQRKVEHILEGKDESIWM